MLKQIRFSGLVLTVILLSGFPAKDIYASELGELFASYQAAVEGGDAKQVRETAAAVYEYTKQRFPEDNKNRAAAALNYTKSLFADRQYALAEEVASEALALYESVYGEGSVDLIDPHLELARAIASNSRASWNHRKSFYRHAEKALRIAEEHSGEDSALYALAALDAGRISLDQAGSRRAEGYLKVAHAAFDGPHKKYSLRRFLSKFYLGKYYMAQNRYSTAMPYLESALDLADIEGSPDSRMEMTARAFLVDVYENLGETEKSIAQCRAIGEMVPFDMDQEPTSLIKRSPKYPMSALRNRREGYAIVNFTIADNGIPTDIVALETGGSKSFGDAAEDYVKELRYAPRFVDGKAVDTPDRKVKIKFSLAE